LYILKKSPSGHPARSHNSHSIFQKSNLIDKKKNPSVFFSAINSTPGNQKKNTKLFLNECGPHARREMEERTKKIYEYQKSFLSWTRIWDDEPNDVNKLTHGKLECQVFGNNIKISRRCRPERDDNCQCVSQKGNLRGDVEIDLRIYLVGWFDSILLCIIGYRRFPFWTFYLRLSHKSG
jgi:hypothetical protein